LTMSDEPDPTILAPTRRKFSRESGARMQRTAQAVEGSGKSQSPGGAKE
jgi:hypothetical protein